ncbi:hypothetical protein CY34DRAFT_789897 [Suillus luteus UH-Slu-Lm8-n1]|uniref:Unplaced genomic scaffold CY34scaffold_771, whole genome shotgun sequence n=1 Tax=Suillus luteus UH-Slu-Lm8-n1 TaxID=930992 RepID=A0A0D0ANQ0_9AGAM|nr:hypothetical protein CY34DRAFT_789897 [Suillus luteus UH-Slu-Lm8-n1]
MHPSTTSSPINCGARTSSLMHQRYREFLPLPRFESWVQSAGFASLQLICSLENSHLPNSSVPDLEK